MLEPSLIRLSEDLRVFKSPICLVEKPQLWLHSNIQEINTAISNVQAAGMTPFPQQTTVVYPRFYTFVLASLMAEGSDERNILIESQKHWSSLSKLGCLALYKTIKNTLWDALSSCRSVKCMNVYERAAEILQIDVLCIAAQIMAILSEKEAKREFLTLRSGAWSQQALIDLLQALLDFTRIESAHPSLLRALLSLSKATGLIPSNLIHVNVIKESQFAIDGGGFGDVWKGRLENQPVAMKVMRNTRRSFEDTVRIFSREAILWRQFHHPNVLPFYGVYRWPQDKLSYVTLLSPWMDNGNIIEYLEQDHGNRANRHSLVHDIACGIEYLHNFKPPVIHGDLKGNNILITASGRACVADFGLGNLVQDPSVQTRRSSIAMGGTVLFSAPELFGVSVNELTAETLDSDAGGDKPIPKTLATDIYAFGCVCFQIFEGTPRFFHHRHEFRQMMAILKNEPTHQPQQMSNCLWKVVQTCWLADPDRRPSINEIIQEFTSDYPYQKANTLEWDGGILSRLRSQTFTALGMPPAAALIEPPNESASQKNFTTPSDVPNICDSPVSHVPPINPSSRRVDSGPSPSSSHGVTPCHTQESVSAKSSTSTDSNLVLRSDEMVIRLVGRTGTSKSSMFNRLKSRPATPISVGVGDIQPNDIVIPVMGPTGVGKSTFINHLKGSLVAPVSDGFDSCTQKLQHYVIDIPERYCDHKLQGSRLVLVDTPGFDSTSMDDSEVLRRIATWLATAYESRMSIGGVVYLYGLYSSRMTWSERHNLEIFKEICGPETFPRIILGTTQWSFPQSKASGERREVELKTKFWSDMMESGSTMHRLDNDGASSWNLVEIILKRIVNEMNEKRIPQYSILLQRQLVDQRKDIAQTTPGALVTRKRGFRGKLEKILHILSRLFSF